MCDENDNEQEGKVAPSMLDLHGKASEEHPEAKENFDSPAKVIVEPLKPFENGQHLPAADVLAAVDEVECNRVDTPTPSSTNVDVADGQQCSVEHNCESSEAAAPLDSEPDVTACKDMNTSDIHGAPVDPTRESVETLDPLYTENEAIADENAEVLDNLIHSVEPICDVEGSAGPIRESVEGSAESIHGSVEGSAEPMHRTVEGSVGPIDQCVEGFVGPINQSVEGSVEPSHESVEPFMDPIYESVEATISVERKDEVAVDENGGTTELASQESEVNDSNLAASHLQYDEPVVLAKVEDFEINENKSGDAEDNQQPAVQEEFASHVSSHDVDLENKTVEPTKTDALTEENGNASSEHLFLDEYDEGCVSGTEELQSSFTEKLENFFKERNMEFKPPKFYGEGLNCLKLWRSVIRLGGYDKSTVDLAAQRIPAGISFVPKSLIIWVTSSKLWRQVGESFRPPKTCTTVSWTFRGFYEKALLDFEREKIPAGELNIQAPSTAEHMSVDNQSSVSVRTPRDAAARARQGWHSPRLLGHGEVSGPIIKEKSAFNAPKHEKQLKSSGSLKRKKQPFEEDADTTVQPKSFKMQLRSLDPVCCPQSTNPEGFLLDLVTMRERMVIGDGDTRRQVDVSMVDIGLPADWVKVNVQKTMDCFEVYALVPGLLREEVRVQSDPAGRLVISGDPEQPDNPWGVTPFEKVINLPSRIDPRQTSAVVTLHGQLFVRIPFEQADR